MAHAGRPLGETCQARGCEFREDESVSKGRVLVGQGRLGMRSGGGQTDLIPCRPRAWASPWMAGTIQVFAQDCEMI